MPSGVPQTGVVEEADLKKLTGLDTLSSLRGPRRSAGDQDGVGVSLQIPTLSHRNKPHFIQSGWAKGQGLRFPGSRPNMKAFGVGSSEKTHFPGGRIEAQPTPHLGGS